MTASKTQVRILPPAPFTIEGYGMSRIGRPRDEVYEAVVTDVTAHVKRHPDQKDREWVYDISSKDSTGNPSEDSTADLRKKRARFLGFRQSTAYKELYNELKTRGFKCSLTFVGGSESGGTAHIRILKNG